MSGPLREIFDVISGSRAGLLIALFGLIGIIIGAAIDPLAAAIVTVALLIGLIAIFVFALRQRAVFAGPYVVIEETITWDLVRADGSLAYLEKRQKVVFNYLQVTFLERATGSAGGDIFNEFECDFGEPIERIERDDEEALIILMKPERTRGEETVLSSRRAMTDLFPAAEEWISFGFSQQSHSSELVVKFPAGANVRNVRIAGPSGPGSRPAEKTELSEEGGRLVLRVGPSAYREHEDIKVTWTWR